MEKALRELLTVLLALSLSCAVLGCSVNLIGGDDDDDDNNDTTAPTDDDDDNDDRDPAGEIDFDLLSACFEENCYDLQVEASQCTESCSGEEGVDCWQTCAEGALLCMEEECDAAAFVDCVWDSWDCIADSCSGSDSDETCAEDCNETLAECANTTVEEMNAAWEDQHTWE
jgi:hypothetical protein